MGIKIFAALLMNPSTRGFVGFVKLFFFCAIQIFPRVYDFIVLCAIRVYNSLVNIAKPSFALLITRSHLPR